MRKLLKQALALTTSVAMCLSMASPVLTVYAEDATVPTTDSYVDAGDMADVSPFGSIAAPDTSDTEAADTEAANTEAANTEAADTEAADTEPADAETTDTEAADTEAADTETADTEPADAETTDTEAADTEAADTETADAEPAEPEPEAQPAEPATPETAAEPLAVLDPESTVTTANVGDTVTLSVDLNREDVEVTYQWQVMRQPAAAEIEPVYQYAEDAPTWYNYPLEDKPEADLLAENPAATWQGMETYLAIVDALDEIGEDSSNASLAWRTDAFLTQKRKRRNAADFLLDVTDAVTGTMVQSVSAVDFEGESAKSAGLQSARAGAMAEATAVVETGKTVVYLGKAAVPLVRDMRSGVMDAKQAVSYGRTVVGKQFLRSGSNLLRSTARLGASQTRQFRVESDDFSADTAMTIKDGAGAIVRGGRILVRIIRGFAQNLGRSLLLGGIAALVMLSLLLVNAISMASAAVSTSVLAAHNTEDVGKLVNYLNQYRNEAITEDIYNAFRSERDPNGNPYGYTTLDGKTSNNLQHGVTWNYANGISNDTAEIISMASVYFQQDWPPSSTFSLFDGTFFDYCRMLTAYGLDVTAQESAPYSCLSYGGCVQGWRSEGETVTIQDYMAETHFCHEGTAECGHWVGRRWQWEVGHIEGQRLDRWVPSGSHTVTVYFPVQLPAGAAESELTALPAGAAVIGSSVQAADCYGSLILGDTNLYTGDPDGWFISPGSYSTTFEVVTGSGYNAVTDTYTVSFSNAAPVAWCPGELQDSRYGHYDLDCTIYMAGCDSYAEPETAEPDGDAGGSGTLQALAAASNGGSLTRTVRKLSYDGTSYTTGTTQRYTKTVTLPQPEPGFTGWDADAIEWAELLYKMDWEDLYNVTDGIKCRTVGTRLTDEELAAILQALGLMDGSPRAQIVGFALTCQGRFSYGQPTSLRGSAGAAIVGSNLDCSSFIQYCYWSLGLPFSAKTTANYAGAGDLAEISPSQIQPGDLRVVYASGGTQGHVQMYVGGNAWIECAAGYGVGLNLSNGFMTSRPCHYFSYVGF